MELSKKVKTALDETRMLMLGANILLGFELRGAFAETFDRLPAHDRFLDGAGLMLMVLVAALLIAPEPYHRIVEGGNDSGGFHNVVTDIADLALLPFALSIGIDVAIAIENAFGRGPATAAGCFASFAAFALWYGLPRARRRTTGERERKMTERQRGERDETPLHAKIEQCLTEARVILPGAQALFGFQLSIVLTAAFERLSPFDKAAHAASLCFVALSVMLLMAPAAYHRIVYAGEDSQGMNRAAGLLITLATAPLALGLAVDIYVVMARIGGPTVGIACGAGALLLLLGLWYGWPLTVALLCRDRQPSRREGSQRQSG